MTDSDDFQCLNEEEGVECDYPYCECEAKWIEENFELPALFEHEDFSTEYEDGWLEED